MGERKNSYKRIILMCYHQKIIIIILLLGRLLKNLLLVTFSFIILKILNRKRKILDLDLLIIFISVYEILANG